MQFLVSVIAEGTGLATEAEMAAIDEFNERLVAEGHWVFAGGLGSPSTATVIDNRDGAGVATDGPFLESKEYVAGFWILEAADQDVARELATEGSKQCNRKVELRPLLASDGHQVVIRPGAGQLGCQSSTRFPSGSVTQPNRPTPSMSAVSSATSAPLRRSCASIASRSRTRKLSIVCWVREPK